jgi:hypothetical protein
MIPITPKLEKIIETKQIFADLAFKDARERRFGLTPCCKGDVEKYSTVNEICDYEDLATKLNRGETYEFTTWNWYNWMDNGTDPAPDWAIREETYYSSKSRFGHDIINASAPSAGTDYVVTIDSFLLNAMRSNPATSWEGTYIYALILRDIDGLPESANTDFANLVTKQCSITSANSDLDSPKIPEGTNYDTTNFRSYPFDKYHLWKARFICINPGGTIVPAAGSMTLNLRMNTSAAGVPKNGAKVGDYIWIVQQRAVGPNMTNADRVPQNIRRWNVTTGEYDNSGNPPDYASDWSFTLVRNAPTGFPPLPGGTDRFAYASNTATDDRADFISGGTATIGDDNISTLPQLIFWNAEENRYQQKFVNTKIDATDNVQPGYNICVNDSEEIIIYVKDALGNIASNYPINIDNTSVGKTDKNGRFVYTIENASTNTKHIINDCKCFVTTGGCNQQKIDITLSKLVKPTCTDLAIDCL